MTYQRNGRMDSEKDNIRKNEVNALPQEPENSEEKAYRVHGFEQIIEMLHIAEKDFRDSLLKRIEAQNPELAKSLKRALVKTP